MNRNTIKHTLTTAAITTAAGLATLIGPTTAHATDPGVHARDGVIYAADGTALTDDEVNSSPVVSPNGTAIAYIHNNTIWIMKPDGTDKRQLSDRTGTTPTWSHNSTRITYTATSCTGNPGTFRVDTRNPGTPSQPMLPRTCRNQPAPQVGYING